MALITVPTRTIIYDTSLPTTAVGPNATDTYAIQRKFGERGTFQFWLEALPGSPLVLGSLFIAGQLSQDKQGITTNTMNVRGPIDIGTMGAGATWIESDVPLLPRMFIALPQTPVSGWIDVQLHVWFMQ